LTRRSSDLGRAEAGDRYLTGRAGGIAAEAFAHFLADLVQNPARLAIIDLACGPDEPGKFGRLADDEPGIDSDAMAADAGSRLQYVDARVPVGEPDQFPHIDSELVAYDQIGRAHV